MHVDSPEFEALYDAMKAFVDTCMSGHDPSHNPAHVHRVVSLANKILVEEQARRPEGQLDGASLDPTTMVEHALLQQNAPKGIASKVQKIVSHVSYTTECKDPAVVRQLIDTGYPELAVVQDADRLDAIGAIGIGRCFTFLGAVGKKYAVDGKWEMDNSIEHFSDKLEKLEGMMKTETGRKMARVRTERLNIFRGWWEEEMNDAKLTF
ncbi:hypothetical protein N7468_000831 [Penicillium chermesinum]|uniref:Uncharacterized protein n=1 Tax=Penicillium chermesinum TaxID=63820 RepID=A0A9W9PHP4_9EURO|nr:uncharacterized protein N7468_000831 [Penicillium chermesinum]KAJ5245848.1 hypothetical protein N7468_000831 [Penicillium chermesinum]